MTSLLLYALAAFGLAYIIGHAKISLPFRLLLEPDEDPGFRGGNDEHTPPYVKTAFRDSLRWWLLLLLECPACLGFWIGLIYGWVAAPDFGFGVVSRAGAAFQLALFTCASNLLLTRAAALVEAKDE